jgi:hypothetical protein
MTIYLVYAEHALGLPHLSGIFTNKIHAERYVRAENASETLTGGVYLVKTTTGELIEDEFISQF